VPVTGAYGLPMYVDGANNALRNQLSVLFARWKGPRSKRGIAVVVEDQESAFSSTR
jgi:hypothetical protein